MKKEWESEYSGTFGSSHWFGTMCSRIKACSQFMQDHPGLYTEVYLKIIERASKDLIRARDKGLIKFSEENR